MSNSTVPSIPPLQSTSKTYLKTCAVACDQYNPAEYRFANSVSSCSLHPPNFADGIRIRTEGQTDGRHCCYLLPIRLQGPEVNDSRAVSSGAADLELNPLALALLLHFVTHCCTSALQITPLLRDTYQRFVLLPNSRKASSRLLIASPLQQ